MARLRGAANPATWYWGPEVHRRKDGTLLRSQTDVVWAYTPIEPKSDQWPRAELSGKPKENSQHGTFKEDMNGSGELSTLLKG